MKSLYLFILAVFLVLISSSDSRSQDQTFNLGAINVEYSDTLGGTNNQLFFDIVLQHTNYGFSFPFEYSIGQYFLEFNPNIANGGTLSYKIVDSDIPFIYQPRNPNVLGNLLRLAGNSITNPGYFISSISPGTRIVRMRLTTSASSFAEEPIDLRWKITGTVRTKIGIRNIINIEISDNGTYYTDSLVNYVNLLYPVEKSIVPASSVNFIWNKVNTAARYTLLVSADSNMNSILYNDSLITDTVKNVSGLILGNRFFWRIAVHETSGNTYYSKVKDFYTKHLTVYPPDNSSELPQSITFNWNRPGSNISHYLFNISKDSLFNESTYLDTLITDTSLFLRGFEYNAKYFWKVYAVYNDSSIDVSNIKSFKTKTVIVNLGYPLNNAVNQSNTINFNWQSPVVNAERYFLKISDDSLQNNLIYYDSVDNITNKTVGPLELNKKFYWSVSFRDSFDYEVRSQIRNFKTGMLIVNLITPINNAIVVPLNTYLIWKKPVINATRYKLILSRDSLQNDIVLNDSAITDTLRYISGLEYETFYYWSVTAYDTLGNVKTSDVWKFLSTSFLINPAFASYIYNNSANFVWHKMAGAISYKLEVAEDYEFTRKVFADSAITDTVRLVDPLPYSFSYYWKVSLKDINGYFRTSQVWIFSRDFPVPVELSGFVSEVNQNNVKLNWTTASETNNSGFDIERSDNGIWLKIGSVSGNGNSNVENNYSYTDKNLNTGIYNYRLKQLDFNGNFEYYDLENEVNIGIPLKYELSQNYPNPFNPSTKINFNLPADVHVSLKIFDMTGREIKTLVNEVKTAGYHSVLFSGNDISSGVYFYILKTNNFKAGRKMLLIK